MKIQKKMKNLEKFSVILPKDTFDIISAIPILTEYENDGRSTFFKTTKKKQLIPNLHKTGEIEKNTEEMRKKSQSNNNFSLNNNFLESTPSSTMNNLNLDTLKKPK